MNLVMHWPQILILVYIGIKFGALIRKYADIEDTDDKMPKHAKDFVKMVMGFLFIESIFIFVLYKGGFFGS